MTASINRDELKRKLESSQAIVLVEALPAKYFAEAHLPAALNIPHDQVQALARALLPDKQAEIVVYCASAACKNSSIAAQRLSELGYQNVRAYVEGKADWIAAGYAVERAPGTPT